MKETTIRTSLLILIGLLIIFYLNTITLIIVLAILILLSIYDVYKKPTKLKVLLYIVIFSLLFIYIYINK